MTILNSALKRPSAWLTGAAMALLLTAGLAQLPQPAVAQGVDINVIFNCEPDGPLGTQDVEQCAASRVLLLGTCTACHTFVPIVKAQKTETQWGATLQVHRSRVPDVNSEDFEQLRQFLVAHFNEENPPPALPPELEALGTGLPF